MEMSKEDLIARAMFLEEIEIRRASLGTATLGGIHAEMVKFAKADLEFRARLAGNKPPSPKHGKLLAAFDESKIVAELEETRRRLEVLSLEELKAEVARLEELTERRSALCQIIFERFAEDCVNFGGASASLSRGEKAEKGSPTPHKNQGRPRVLASELPADKIDELFSVFSRVDDAQRQENNLLGRRLAEANALGAGISKEFDTIEAELKAEKKRPKDILGAVGNLHLRQDALFNRLRAAAKDWQENTHKRDEHAERRISEIRSQPPEDA